MNLSSEPVVLKKGTIVAHVKPANLIPANVGSEK